MQRSVWIVFKLLATSRKVWVALIGAGGAVYLYAQRLISADKLASALVALATAVIVAIAAEDSAQKIGGAKAAVVEPEPTDFDPRCCVCGEPATYVAKGPKWYCEEHKPLDAISVTVRHV